MLQSDQRNKGERVQSAHRRKRRGGSTRNVVWGRGCEPLILVLQFGKSEGAWDFGGGRGGFSHEESQDERGRR